MVKKIIVEKYGPEGEVMMKAFLEAVDSASKQSCPDNHEASTPARPGVSRPCFFRIFRPARSRPA